METFDVPAVDTGLVDADRIDDRISFPSATPLRTRGT